MYVIGSTLINKLFSKFRPAKDLDIAVNVEMSEAEKVSLINYLKSIHDREVEIHYIPCHPNRELNKNELYTLKVSHAIYNIHWRKTMSDVRFLQLNGCKIDKSFLHDLRSYWENVHTASKHVRTNFEVDFADFFKDNVRRKLPHDMLHLAFNDSPAYKLVITEGFVKPEVEKFIKLPKELKDKVVLEEAFVIAVERYYSLPYKTAYLEAQRDLVTRLHPIFLADYVIEYWQELYTAPYNFYKQYESWKECLNLKN